MTTNRKVRTVVDLLKLDEFNDVPADPHLWGFGGFHGGMSVALAARATQRHASDMRLRSITAQFHRSVRGSFTISTQLVKVGRATAAVSAETSTSDGVCVTSTALYARGQGAQVPPLMPPSPIVPSPKDCNTFEPPVDFAPFARQVVIKPTDDNRPFAAGPAAELTAWIRVRSDDLPPTPDRVLFLFDALAPSYGVILNAQRPIPTLEMSVHLTDNAGPDASPWVLLSARTDTASASGWSTEHLDMWDRAGRHLGSSRQLRLASDVRR